MPIVTGTETGGVVGSDLDPVDALPAVRRQRGGGGPGLLLAVVAIVTLALLLGGCATGPAGSGVIPMSGAGPAPSLGVGTRTLLAVAVPAGQAARVAGTWRMRLTQPGFSLSVPASLVLEQSGGRVRGIVTVGGARYETWGIADKDSVILRWDTGGMGGAAYPEVRATVVAGGRLRGAWGYGFGQPQQSQQQTAPVTATRLGPAPTLLFPPYGTPIPSPTPTLIAYATPTPVPSPSATPHIADPAGLSGHWSIPSGLTALHPQDVYGDGRMVLVQRGTRVSGEVSQDGARYALIGTYDPRRRALDADVAMPDPTGNRVHMAVTVGDDGLSAAGLQTTPSDSGFLILSRLDDRVPAAPAPSPAQPTVVPLATPYPDGYVDGAWEWSDTGPTIIDRRTGHAAAPVLLLHKEGGRVAGILYDGRYRYEVRGAFDATSRRLDLSFMAPTIGEFSIGGVLSADDRVARGGWAGPPGDGGSDIHRVAAAPTVPPGAPPVARCVPPGRGMSGWWYIGAGPSGLAHGADAQQADLDERGGTVTGIVVEGVSRIPVRGSYNHATGALTLAWSQGNKDAVHLRATIPEGADRGDGEVTTRLSDGGVAIERRACLAPPLRAARGSVRAPGTIGGRSALADGTMDARWEGNARADDTIGLEL